MDIAHLKTFLEIYRIRHFGKAADKLCITQSAASARIKLLEERLGVSLFVRDRHGIEPTPAGHRFHQYAEVTVNGWDRARQMVALPESYTRHLTIGCLPDSWHLFLATKVDGIHAALSDTVLNLSIHPGSNIPSLLLDGSLDIGFVFEAVNTPMLRAVSVAQLDLQLVANYPDAHVADALSEDYVLVDWGALFQYEHSKAFANIAQASIRTNSGLMASDLLRSGRRAAYLPVQKDVIPDNGVMLYPVHDAPVFTSQLFAVMRSDSEQLVLIEEVLSAISKET